MDKVTRAKGKIFEAAVRGLPVFVCRSRTSKGRVGMLMFMGSHEFKDAKTGVCMFPFRIKKWDKLQARQWRKRYEEKLPLTEYMLSELQAYEYVKLTPHEAIEIVEFYERFL